MEKETVSRAFRYVDDQGTVRDVEITVRKDVNTHFLVGATMYFDEQGVSHDIVGSLVEKQSELEHLDLSKCHYIDGKPVLKRRSKRACKAE